MHRARQGGQKVKRKHGWKAALKQRICSDFQDSDEQKGMHAKGTTHRQNKKEGNM